MISKEEVEELAQLARLELTQEEKIGLQKDISNILDYMGQVSGVAVAKTKNIVPLLHNVMREDKPYDEKTGIPTLGKREALLEALPRREGDYNVVRKIIQKDE